MMSLERVVQPDGSITEVEMELPVSVLPVVSHEETVRLSYGSRLADVFQGNRSSLNSYALRILATSDPTEEMKADLATFKALDLWEEAMLAARDAAIANGSEPSWPDPPPGGIDLVMACT